MVCRIPEFQGKLILFTSQVFFCSVRSYFPVFELEIQLPLPNTFRANIRHNFWQMKKILTFLHVEILSLFLPLTICDMFRIVDL